MSAPATITRFPGVSLFLSDSVMSGTVTYDARTSQLAIAYADGEVEVLSIDLTLEGYLAAPRECLIKDPHIERRSASRDKPVVRPGDSSPSMLTHSVEPG
ncbi:MAG: hypothetical protein ACQEUF_09085 [Actinomycetota bacterium]